MNDLTKFISHVRNHGVARSNRFRVTIPLPSKLDSQVNKEEDENSIASWVKTGIRLATIFTGGTVEGARGLQVMCSATQLPGSNIDTSDANHTGHSFKVATGTSKTDIDFSFLLSGDMLEKQVIDRWKEIIVNSKTKKIGYYDDYTTDIQIDVLDNMDKVVYTSILEEAYPVLFNVVDLDKEDTDNFLKYQLAFTYKTETKPDVVATNPLLDLTPVQMAQDFMNGDLDSVADKARVFKQQLDAGTLKTSLGMETYGMCGNVLNASAGVGMNDMEGVIGGLKTSVKGTSGLDSGDSGKILGALDGLL